MTREEAIAYVHAQSVAASIKLAATLAANEERARAGHAQAYPEMAIAQIIDDYGISHNAVLALFQASQP